MEKGEFHLKEKKRQGLVRGYGMIVPKKFWLYLRQISFMFPDVIFWLKNLGFPSNKHSQLPFWRGNWWCDVAIMHPDISLLK